MAGVLSAVLDDIEAQLVTSSGIDGIKFNRGKFTLGENDAPPRIVWVRPSAQPMGVDRPGGNPRRVNVRRVTVVAHIWGADYDATEKLVHQTMRAIHMYASGVYAIASEVWPTEADMSANENAGDLCLLTWWIDIPVFDAAEQAADPDTSVTITDATLVSNPDAAPGDGKLSFGEP